MKRWFKRIGLGLLGAIVVAAIVIAIWVYTQTSAYDASVDKVYDIPLSSLDISNDPAVIARGKHLSESIMVCSVRDCHGGDLAGGEPTGEGPLGSWMAPNLTTVVPAYTDPELARLIRHGVKKDGRSVRFMPSHDINWVPESDLVALISYLRTLTPIDKPSGPVDIGWLAKVLDRQGTIDLDIARRIDHDKIEIGPLPSPTAEYGKYISRLCRKCHGEEHFSGGHMPGTPSDFPTPLNLTPHETGLKDWTYEDFVQVMDTGIRKNGEKLDGFMPVEAIRKMDETEKRALWAFLRSLPPVPFGER
jgi:hypothetical protein